jgi:hypothetical protein
MKKIRIRISVNLLWEYIVRYIYIYTEYTKTKIGDPTSFLFFEYLKRDQHKYVYHIYI